MPDLLNILCKLVIQHIFYITNSLLYLNEANITPTLNMKKLRQNIILIKITQPGFEEKLSSEHNILNPSKKRTRINTHHTHFSFSMFT